jgi:hypothetical protein
VRADLCEEVAALLACNLLTGNCGRSAAADEAKFKRHALASLLLNWQIERAAETESMPAHARGIRQGHVGEALEQLAAGSRQRFAATGVRLRNDVDRCQRLGEDLGWRSPLKFSLSSKMSSSRLADSWIVITVSPCGSRGCQPSLGAKEGFFMSSRRTWSATSITHGISIGRSQVSMSRRSRQSVRLALTIATSMTIRAASPAQIWTRHRTGQRRPM